MNANYFTQNEVQEIFREEGLPELKQFKEEFLRDRLTELVEVKRNLENTDLRAIGGVVHRWKGYSVPYGFQLLESLSKEIEKCVDEEDIKKCTELIFKVEEYLELKRRGPGEA